MVSEGKEFKKVVSDLVKLGKKKGYLTEKDIIEKTMLLNLSDSELEELYKELKNNDIEIKSDSESGGEVEGKTTNIKSVINELVEIGKKQGFLTYEVIAKKTSNLDLDAEFPEAVLVSEWGEPDKSLQGGFHMDFLLHFGPSHYNDLFRCEEPFFSGRGKGDVAAFVEKYKENYEKAQRKGLICIPSGNHDMDRLARSIHGEELKVAFAFLLSMPGAPFLYYGDEIGMRYVENLHSVEGGYGRTGSRSPMQWDHTTNAGFSAAPKEKLYVKQDEATDRPTVEAQMADPDSLYHEIQKLINIRQAHSALQSRGEIEFVYAEEKQYPLAYLRSDDKEKILVIINPADREASFDGDYAVKEALYTFGGEAAFAGGKVTVPGGSAGFYLL